MSDKTSDRLEVAQARAALAAAKTPEQAAAASAGIEAVQTRQAHRACLRTVLIVSDPHRPVKERGPCKTAALREKVYGSEILVAAYKMLGEKARTAAASAHRPVTEADVDSARLDAGDLKTLKQLADAFGAEGQRALERARALLDKHVAPAFMTKSALVFLEGSFAALTGSQRNELSDMAERHQHKMVAIDEGHRRKRGDAVTTFGMETRRAQQQRRIEWLWSTTVSGSIDERTVKSAPRARSFVAAYGRLLEVRSDPGATKKEPA